MYTPEGPADTSINIFNEWNKFKTTFNSLDKVKGSIIISEGEKSESGGTSVHFCGYIYEDNILKIFDPSYHKDDKLTGEFYLDFLYKYLKKKQKEEKKTKEKNPFVYENVYEDRPHPWQGEFVEPSKLLKKDVFCQTWTLKWLLKPNDSKFTLPNTPEEAANRIAHYYHEFVVLIKRIRKNTKKDEPNIIQFIPEEKWNGFSPNSVLKDIEEIEAGDILQWFHKDQLLKTADV